MADLTITAADVGLHDNTASTKRVQFGEAVGQGEPVYLKSTDNKYWKAQADGTAEEADAAGVTIDKADADGWGFIVREGKFNPGAVVAVGTIYCVSAAAGKICPYADITSGQRVKILGPASAADEIDLYLGIDAVVKA